MKGSQTDPVRERARAIMTAIRTSRNAEEIAENALDTSYKHGDIASIEHMLDVLAALDKSTLASTSEQRAARKAVLTHYLRATNPEQ